MFLCTIWRWWNCIQSVAYTTICGKVFRNGSKWCLAISLYTLLHIKDLKHFLICYIFLILMMVMLPFTSELWLPSPFLYLSPISFSMVCNVAIPNPTRKDKCSIPVSVVIVEKCTLALVCNEYIRYNTMSSLLAAILWYFIWHVVWGMSVQYSFHGAFSCQTMLSVS